MWGFVCAFTFYSLGRPKSCPFHLTHHHWQVVQTEVIHHGCNQYMMGALTCQPHSCLPLAHANAISSARTQHRGWRQISALAGGIANFPNCRYLFKGLIVGYKEVFISLLQRVKGEKVNCWTISIYIETELSCFPDFMLSSSCCKSPAILELNRGMRSLHGTNVVFRRGCKL